MGMGIWIVKGRIVRRDRFTGWGLKPREWHEKEKGWVMGWGVSV